MYTYSTYLILNIHIQRLFTGPALIPVQDLDYRENLNGNLHWQRAFNLGLEHVQETNPSSPDQTIEGENFIQPKIPGKQSQFVFSLRVMPILHTTKINIAKISIKVHRKPAHEQGNTLCTRLDV